MLVIRSVHSESIRSTVQFARGITADSRKFSQVATQLLATARLAARTFFRRSANFARSSLEFNQIGDFNLPLPAEWTRPQPTIAAIAIDALDTQAQPRSGIRCTQWRGSCLFHARIVRLSVGFVNRYRVSPEPLFGRRRREGMSPEAPRLWR